MQAVPLTMFIITKKEDTFDFDAAVEHWNGYVNAQIGYQVDGNWMCRQYAMCSWSYIRRKIIEVLPYSPSGVFVQVFLGLINEQQIAVDVQYEA